MILLFIFSGFSLFALTSFIRYKIIYNSKSEKNISFPAYDIGSFVTKYRNTGNFQKDKIHGSIKNHSLPLSPVIADSILFGANIFHQYMCIDENMYEGISKLSGENIDTFSDLSAKLETYQHNWQGLTEGSLNKIKGHIAESHVAEHFQKAGITVEWPETSNQEGWDLLLNGNPIQVKLTKDANSLIEHFKNNSDIPVVIPYDAENVPENAFHFNSSENIDDLFAYLKDNLEKSVIVDEQLSNIESTEHIEEGTDLLTGSIDGHFPFIIFAFASWREIKLFKNNDTDLKSAIKNLSLDVGGVGAGMAIGSKIGTFILPGIGTIAGGIAGACLARNKITNAIKYKPFKETEKKYEKSIKKLNKETKNVEKNIKEKFNEDKKREQSILDEKAKEIKIEINEKIKELKRWRVEKEKLPVKLLTELPTTILSIRKKLGLGWIEHFWPNKKTITYKREITMMKRQLQQQVKNNGFIDRGVLFQKLSEKGLFRSYILSEIKTVENERIIHENNLMAKIKEIQKRLLDQRHQSMKIFAKKIEEYGEKIRKELLPYIKEVCDYQKLLEIEAKKLNMQVRDRLRNLVNENFL